VPLKRLLWNARRRGGPMKKTNNAITAFLGLIAKKLGMSLKAEFTDKGCKMVIGK